MIQKSLLNLRLIITGGNGGSFSKLNLTHLLIKESRGSDTYDLSPFQKSHRSHSTTLQHIYSFFRLSINSLNVKKQSAINKDKSLLLNIWRVFPYKSPPRAPNDLQLISQSQNELHLPLGLLRLVTHQTFGMCINSLIPFTALYSIELVAQG